MTAARPLHIVLSGGGTGGHLFPGLATAERLCVLRPNAQITVAGAGPAWLGEHVRTAGYQFLELPCRPAPTSLRGVLRFLAGNLAAYRAARRFLARHSAAVVIGLGGYASVPMARAALARRVPLVLLEQNAVPGKATRFLARRASAICLALPPARGSLPALGTIQRTGNPVREAFTHSAPVAAGPPQLLVLGGSGGAQALNRHVPEALAPLARHLGSLRIVHQTGPRDVEEVAMRYTAASLCANVVAWLDDMAATMRQSALAVARAGGTTLAELAASALPAILVPYPHATANHQQANAHVFAAAGAARVVEQGSRPDAFLAELTGVLAELLTEPSLRESMRAAMHQLARPHAADTVARLVLRLAGDHS